MTLSKYIQTMTAMVGLFISQLAAAADFAVSPMMIEMEAVPRATQDFSFTIFGRTDADIKLSLFDMNQLETVYMGFQQANFDSENSMSSWVSLDDDRFRVREGETMEVTGSIEVPARAAGTYLLGIMVEEDIDEDEQSGIALRVRYAVVLNMRVEGSRSRRIQTSFEELAVVEQEDGTYLHGTFTNDSSIDEWLLSQVQIRSDENRLLERVEMKTESAWQRGDEASRIFPGAKVTVFGKLSKTMATGNYNVLVRNRFADKSQPVYRDTLRFERKDQEGAEAITGESDDAAGAPEQVAVEVSPAVVPIDIRNNGTSFSSFFIVNNGSEEIAIDLPAQVDNMESQGIADFQFYPNALVLQPNQRSRVVLKQTHLADAVYGNTVFQAAMTANGSTEQIEIKTQGGS